MPGDYATVEADGTITLLGRGSVCINTGGEKVFPEEVEEVLKLHPAVRDAVAVGVPDEKFGEAITAVVEPQPGATVDEGDVIAHVKGKLAAYKAPKRVVVVESIQRARPTARSTTRACGASAARLEAARRHLPDSPLLRPWLISDSTARSRSSPAPAAASAGRTPSSSPGAAR